MAHRSIHWFRSDITQHSTFISKDQPAVSKASSKDIKIGLLTIIIYYFWVVPKQKQLLLWCIYIYCHQQHGQRNIQLKTGQGDGFRGKAMDNIKKYRKSKLQANFQLLQAIWAMWCNLYVYSNFKIWIKIILRGFPLLKCILVECCTFSGCWWFQFPGLSHQWYPLLATRRSWNHLAMILTVGLSKVERCCWLWK